MSLDWAYCVEHGCSFPVGARCPLCLLALVSRCSCGRRLLPSFRYCDGCGKPLAYTGQTQRLGA